MSCAAFSIDRARAQPFRGRDARDVLCCRAALLACSQNGGGAMRQIAYSSSRSSDGRRRIAIALTVTVLALLPPLAPAAMFTVTSPADIDDAMPGDGQCETAAGNQVCTLRAAIDETNALAGVDVIMLQSGTTYLMTQSTPFNITDSVDVVGAGAAVTTVDGDNTLSIFHVAACRDGATCDAGHPANLVSISGVTLQHGYSDVGAAVNNRGTLLIEDSIIADNVDYKYAAVYNLGTLTVRRTRIHDNVTTPNPGCGGGLYFFVTATIVFFTIDTNQAASGAG